MAADGTDRFARSPDDPPVRRAVASIDDRGCFLLAWGLFLTWRVRCAESACAPMRLPWRVPAQPVRARDAVGRAPRREPGRYVSDRIFRAAFRPGAPMMPPPG